MFNLDMIKTPGAGTPQVHISQNFRRTQFEAVELNLINHPVEISAVDDIATARINISPDMEITIIG